MIEIRRAIHINIDIQMSIHIIIDINKNTRVSVKMLQRSWVFLSERFIEKLMNTVLKVKR